MKQKLFLYLVFHLNLAFSSVEEYQRPEIVRRCYWPILRLAKEYNLPLGIESSAYTLENIYTIDPLWVEELRYLIKKGQCEFVGSGYSQIIGPLVPPEVNDANLRLGNKIYRHILGMQPDIALVNEQAYSAGLIQHYLNAGYRAIIMDWNNPARFHPEWNSSWRFFPQYACGQHGEEIAVIWSNSIAFQKFQRYVHGDMDIEEYVAYIRAQLIEISGAFPLYSNDAEIFDFRPGRYHTESIVSEESEWDRVKELFGVIQKDDQLLLIRPSQVIDLIHLNGAGKRINLESPEQPIPVKKQGKYNVTRWAVTGKDDLGINTICWQIFNWLKGNPQASESKWRELCYLWSSDFRTHITQSRWREYRNRLEDFKQEISGIKKINYAIDKKPEGAQRTTLGSPQFTREGKFLTLETQSSRAKFNCRRGLAIDSLWFNDFEGAPLCTTIPHGFYEDISFGTDWYSGHMVLETLGSSKITDLNPVEPDVNILENGNIVVKGEIPTLLGTVSKRIEISSLQPLLLLNISMDWNKVPMGSLRLGNITLNPEAFDYNTLYYRTCNGGWEDETFPLSGHIVEHGSAVSFLVSANCGLGITSGWVEIGDAKKSVLIDIDKTSSALIGQISYREIGKSFFCRLSLSAGEMDETRRVSETGGLKLECKLRISGRKKTNGN